MTLIFPIFPHELISCHFQSSDLDVSPNTPQVEDVGYLGEVNNAPAEDVGYLDRNPIYDNKADDIAPPE